MDIKAILWSKITKGKTFGREVIGGRRLEGPERNRREILRCHCYPSMRFMLSVMRGGEYFTVAVSSTLIGP